MEFVRANGAPITISMVSNRVMLVAKMAELRRKPIPAKNFKRWANSTAMKLIPQLLSECLLVQELDRLGVAVDSNEFVKVENRYLSKCNLVNADEGERRKAFGEWYETFLEKVRNEAAYMSYLKNCPSAAVTDEDVECERHRQMFTAAYARHKNKKARQRAAEAAKALADGKSWDEVADQYSEDALVDPSQKEYSQSWGSFPNGETGFPEVDECLKSISVGGVSSPLETDDGILIVKVNKIDEDGDYELSRILFRLYVEDNEPVDDQKLRKSLENQNFADIQQKMLAELRGKAHFVYPFGTNFVYEIWK